MEIRLTILETLLLVVANLFAGMILLAWINGELENGFIYFGLVIMAVGILIVKKRVRKKKP